MKKLTLFLGGLILSATMYAQTIEFTLNKALTVGCGSANPLTDMTKKVDVVLEGNKGTLTYASINCKKTIEGVNMGVVNASTQGTAFFDEDEKKGFIVEKNEKVVLFTQKDGKYVAFGAGHIDKKLAKTLNPESDQEAYTEFFGNIDKLLAKAKKTAADEKKIANTYHAPEGNYSDKYGVSGKYYMSEVSDIIVYGMREGDPKYADEVQLELDMNEAVLNIHYGQNQVDKAFFLTQDVIKAFKDGSLSKIYRMRNDHNNHLDAFKGCDMRLLEDGVWLLERYSYFTNRLDCSEPSFQSKEDGRYIIIGKNKDRVMELAKDFEKMKALAEKAVIADCEMLNAMEAARKPMPEPGMKDPKLNAEITAVVKAKAAQAGWPQTVVYVYPKSTEWYTIRNKASGIITGRSIRAIVVMKTTGGKCQWEEVSIAQNFDGANYGKSYFNGNTAIIVPVDCVAAMKYMK
ncbi:MAG: hypothetical protein ACOVO3_07340 [Fluviicola sp.]|jgi:hypothetical protein